MVYRKPTIFPESELFPKYKPIRNVGKWKAKLYGRQRAAHLFYYEDLASIWQVADFERYHRLRNLGATTEEAMSSILETINRKLYQSAIDYVDIVYRKAAHRRMGRTSKEIIAKRAKGGKFDNWSQITYEKALAFWKAKLDSPTTTDKTIVEGLKQADPNYWTFMTYKRLRVQHPNEFLQAYEIAVKERSGIAAKQQLKHIEAAMDLLYNNAEDMAKRLVALTQAEDGKLALDSIKTAFKHMAIGDQPKDAKANTEAIKALAGAVSTAMKALAKHQDHHDDVIDGEYEVIPTQQLPETTEDA